MPDPTEEPIEILLSKAGRYTLASLYSDQRGTIPDLVHGEKVPISVSSCLRISTAPGTRFWGYEDLSTTEVKVAIGSADAPPLAGSWIWPFEDDVKVLRYDDTASDVETKLNSGADMTAVGGVSVRNEGPVFIVAFNANGARSFGTADVDSLAPPSVADIGIVQTGTSDRPAIFTFQLVQRPVGLDILPDPIDTASGSLDVVETGATGVNHKLRISIANRPYAGSFSVTVAGAVSDAIPITATPAQIATKISALSTVGGNNVSVQEEGSLQWLLTFIEGKAETNMGTCSANFTALISRQGKKGYLDLRASNLQLLLQGRSQVDAFMEFNLTPAGGAPRKIRQDVRLLNSIVDPSTAGPVPYDSLAQLVAVPTAEDSPGSRGQFALENGYVHFCVSDGHWRYAALSSEYPTPVLPV